MEMEDSKMKLIEIDGGVSFGLLGEFGATPKPVIFNFCSTWQQGLDDAYFARICKILHNKGYLCVSLDLPCHGDDIKSGEKPELAGWVERVGNGCNIVAEFTKKASLVLDYLAKCGYADMQKISASGTSRGGFLAIHWAASDSRVKNTISFAPVTHLPTLHEFKALQEAPLTLSMSLVNQSEKLVSTLLWITIGNCDQRVGTDQAIRFTQRVLDACSGCNEFPSIELHITSVRGHAIHPTAHDEAVEWLVKK